jgi:hypothetical protein
VLSSAIDKVKLDEPKKADKLGERAETDVSAKADKTADAPATEAKASL